MRRNEANFATFRPRFSWKSMQNVSSEDVEALFLSIDMETLLGLVDGTAKSLMEVIKERLESPESAAAKRVLLQLLEPHMKLPGLFLTYMSSM